MDTGRIWDVMAAAAYLRARGRRQRTNGDEQRYEDLRASFFKALPQNEYGEVEVEVALDAGLMAGTVAMTHGWGNHRTPAMRVAHDHPGANVNRLLPTGPGSFEVLSNQAFMTGIPVEIAAL